MLNSLSSQLMACHNYLEKLGYYGQFDIDVARQHDDVADYICERYTNKQGAQVDDNTYYVIKEWLDDSLAFLVHKTL